MCELLSSAVEGLLDRNVSGMNVADLTGIAGDGALGCRPFSIIGRQVKYASVYIMHIYTVHVEYGDQGL